MKVRFKGKGTQFHPRLGKLEEGKVYDFETFPETLFEVVDGGGKARSGGKGETVNVKKMLKGLDDTNKVRAVVAHVAEMDGGFESVKDTSEDELISEFEEALKKSPCREEILGVFRNRFSDVSGVG